MQIVIPFTRHGEAVHVVQVLVAPGESVSVGQALLVVENTKSVYDVMSPGEGVIETVDVSPGDRITSGVDIIRFADASKVQTASNESVDANIQIFASSPYLDPNENATLIELAVASGDYVEAHQVIAAIQTRKAVVDIQSPARGVLATFHKAVGDRITAGVPLADLTKLDQQYPHFDWVTRSAKCTAQSSLAPAAVPSTPVAMDKEIHLTHLQCALQASVKPPGDGNQAVPVSSPKRQDTLDLKHLTTMPKVDFGQFGAIESKPLSRIRKVSGANLHRNWVMIPHVTNCDEADISELETLRLTLNKEHEKAAAKLTMLTFVIKACVAALRRFPTFNASLDDDKVVFKQYYHIGFAVDTPNGLVVPVIRDVDKKGLLHIAKEMAELSQVARAGKLKQEQMQGGCFTISSLGGIGGTHFTPIINAPEVAILGLSCSTLKPVWDGEKFAPRLMLPLSLSYDHRVIDGAEAARFNAYLASLLADFLRVTL